MAPDGGRRAPNRYAAKHGHRPKNDFGESLFAVTAGEGLAWARRVADADVLAVMPRYLPRWSCPVSSARPAHCP